MPLMPVTFYQQEKEAHVRDRDRRAVVCITCNVWNMMQIWWRHAKDKLLRRGSAAHSSLATAQIFAHERAFWTIAQSWGPPPKDVRSASAMLPLLNFSPVC
eukprot:1160962-Pelagomonas_calceolata.AAC.4